MKTRTLILGLGNDILTDDGVGLRVIRELRARSCGLGGVDLVDTTEMGLVLLDLIVGYNSVLIVDAIQTGMAPPGTVHWFNAGELERSTGRAPHQLGVGETLALGRTLGLAMPSEVRILAVEVEDPFTLGTHLTPSVERAVPMVIERLLAAVVALPERGPAAEAAAGIGAASTD